MKPSGTTLLVVLLLAGFMLCAPTSFLLGQARPMTELAHFRGRLVRFRLRDGSAVHGRLSSADSLPPDGRPLLSAREIPAAAIDSFWVQGRATRSGAMIGGISTGVAALLLSTAICFNGTGCPSSDMGNNDARAAAKRRAVATATLVGAAGGTVVGAVLGSLVRQWHYISTPLLSGTVTLVNHATVVLRVNL